MKNPTFLKSFRVQIVLLASLLGPTGVSHGTILKDQKNLEWASRRDLTSQQFSTAFKTYRDKGYMMIDIDAYPVGQSTILDGLAENTDRRKWAEPESD